jgi:LuxR family transcriptional regulator, maltose regulon positive regulatory protein
MDGGARLADGRPLSRRELEVLALVATGQTNAEVARHLTMTVHAVKFHLASIFRKLGVVNRTQAAALFHASQVANQDVDRAAIRG